MSIEVCCDFIVYIHVFPHRERSNVAGSLLILVHEIYQWKANYDNENHIYNLLLEKLLGFSWFSLALKLVKYAQMLVLIL